MSYPTIIKVLGVVLSGFIFAHLGQALSWTLLETAALACVVLP